jgi:hypothetical protein
VTIGHQSTRGLRYAGFVLTCFAAGPLRTPQGTSSRRSSAFPAPPSPPSAQTVDCKLPTVDRLSNSFPLTNLRKTGGYIPPMFHVESISAEASLNAVPSAVARARTDLSAVARAKAELHIPFPGSAISCRLSAAGALLTPFAAALTRNPQGTPFWSDQSAPGVADLKFGHYTIQNGPPRKAAATKDTEHGPPDTAHSLYLLSYGAVLYPERFVRGVELPLPRALPAWGRFGRAANFNRKALLLP